MSTDTLSSSPRNVCELNAIFSEHGRKIDSDGLTGSLPELLEKLPGAVHKRKIEDIEPGSPDDPIAMLFR